MLGGIRSVRIEREVYIESISESILQHERLGRKFYMDLLSLDFYPSRVKNV
jgi:hypothetical protein